MDFRKPRDETAEVSKFKCRALAHTSSASTGALESSGLKEQSTQLCEVHQWQNELAVVAARALPDSSTFQASQHFDRRDEQGKVRKVLLFW